MGGFWFFDLVFRWLVFIGWWLWWECVLGFSGWLVGEVL